MNQKFIYSFISFAFIFVLAACSSISLPNLTSTVGLTSPSSTQTANTALENKLAVGMLRLEGSDLEITALQAVELLPVWKAVKVMTADKSASSIEIAALYQQTRQTLTADQVQAIQQMSWTQAELDTLMQNSGAQSSELASTSSKSSQTLTSSSASGGDFGGPGGGFGGPGGGLDQQINAITSSQSQTSSSTSKTSSSTSSTKSASSTVPSQPNLNSMFADAVVNLLQQRAGL